MPDLDPQHLFDLGRRLAPLRDEGVLVVGSGFMTHGLPFIHDYFARQAGAPAWSLEFDAMGGRGAGARRRRRAHGFRSRAPGMPYAHPTTEHFAPLFVALGAASKPDAAPDTKIDGYWFGLAKRSRLTLR